MSENNPDLAAAPGGVTDEELGRILYLAVYADQGGKWEANESKSIWADKAREWIRPLLASPAAETAPDAGLVVALEEREASLKALGGCGDGSCIVHIRPGMHTNGGCKCGRDWITMQRFAYINNRFAKACAALSRAGELT